MGIMLLALKLVLNTTTTTSPQPSISLEVPQWRGGGKDEATSRKSLYGRDSKFPASG